MMLDDLLARTVAHPETGCWLWEGATTGDPVQGKTGRGYPRVWFEGRACMVHRVVMALIIGRRVRKDFHVDHNYKAGCRSRLCIRPEHLSVCGHKENMRRRDRARRRRSRQEESRPCV
jgi:hypothetical protein